MDRRSDRKRVEKVIDRKLKRSEIVHHCSDGTLVACEDQAYHLLLHRRERALKACGYKDWRKCHYCGKYDDLNNLCFRECHVFHKECRRRHSQQYRLSHPHGISDKAVQLSAINNFLIDLRE